MREDNKQALARLFNDKGQMTEEQFDRFCEKVQKQLEEIDKDFAEVKEC